MNCRGLGLKAEPSMRHFTRFQQFAILVLTAFGALGGAVSQAASLPLSTKEIGAPAIDLSYEGNPLDRDDALDLSAKGVDLSRLQPLPSDVWQDQKWSAYDDTDLGYPADNAVVEFDAQLPGSNGIARGRILVGQGEQARPFQLLLSLGQHAALAKNALLRKIGYPIPSPRHYSSLRVKFRDTKERDDFLDKVSDATLTARARWVRKSEESFPEVTFQDVVLEPAQIEIPMYHWGVVPSGHLKGRRVLRALIVPFVLLDINESANLFSWEMGKFLSEAVLLTHPYAQNFGEATYDDARWIARRISRLTRQDWEEILRAGRYPEDITALLTEKAVARRNHMVQLFDLSMDHGLDTRVLPYNNKINNGHVQWGKATKAEYDGYALRFTYGDPKSPLRFGEISRYLVIQGINAGLTKLSEMANKYLTIQGPDQVARNHGEKVFRDAIKHYQQNPNTPYSAPVGVWGGPIAGFNVQVSRNVVTGTYFGSDSKVQLVDSIGVGATVGYFMGMDGVPAIIPTAMGNVSVQRNYLHVRPVTDMKSALKTDWKTIFVPGFMHKATKVLFKEGDSENLAESFKEFLDSLKEGEMFVVTDSAAIGARAQVTIPIPILLQPGLTQFNPSFGVGGSAQPQLLRRTTFLRTGDGVQIYLQRVEQLALDVEFNFNWWINLFQMGQTNKWGDAYTQAYLLDKEPKDDAERRKMMISIRALLRDNNSEILEENFSPYTLAHKIDATIQRLKLLWKKWYGVEESHRVVVAPPGYPDKKRILFSHRMVSTRGDDYSDFFNGILRAAVPGVNVNLGPPGGTNPANSFLGKAFWRSVRSEAEITPGEEGAVSTALEYHWAGWRMSHDQLTRLVDTLEKRMAPLTLGKPLVRKDEFATTKSLQMYEIITTLMIYNEGLARLGRSIFAPGGVVPLVKRMVSLEGFDKVNAWCGSPLRYAANSLFGTNEYKVTEGKSTYKFSCLKPWMGKVLKLREKLMGEDWPRNAEDQIKWNTKLVSMLEKEVALPMLLDWIGRDQFFFQARITGFRTHDENGDSEYISDSIGSFSEQQGGGVFRDFSAKYRIMSNELYARYLSEGF